MSMRVQVGALALEVERQEELAQFLELLLRHVNNRELAELLGVTDKTVRRWRRNGRLPGADGGQVTRLHLLQYLDPARALPVLAGSAWTLPASVAP